LNINTIVGVTEQMFKSYYYCYYFPVPNTGISKIMRQPWLATTLLTSWGLAYPTDDPQKPNATSLEWEPCDLDFPPFMKDVIAARGEPIFCATLPVPLDYTSPGDERPLNLQLIKVKANKEPFKGSVLMNPGGPGASGVETVAVGGASIRDVLGGHHDVVGFDPR
jgi:hypothetical protein